MIFWMHIIQLWLTQIYELQAFEVSPTPQDYDLLNTFFAWATSDTIKRTLSVTTHYARQKSLITYGNTGNIVSQLVTLTMQ
jgi:hypothetical protein